MGTKLLTFHQSIPCMTTKVKEKLRQSKTSSEGAPPAPRLPLQAAAMEAGDEEGAGGVWGWYGG